MLFFKIYFIKSLLKLKVVSVNISLFNMNYK